MQVTPMLSQRHYQVIAVRSRDDKGAFSLFASALMPERDSVEQVFCFSSSQKVPLETLITVVEDANLTQQVALFEQPKAGKEPSCILAEVPKPLQLMAYPRALKETLPAAIPWLGAILCWCFIVPISCGAKKQVQPLKFTFHPFFHVATAVLALYPLVLLIQGRTDLIMLFFPVVYLLQLSLNAIATWRRNKAVEAYRYRIWQQIYPNI